MNLPARNHSFFARPWYHLTSSFRDLRLFSALGLPALFRLPVSFHPSDRHRSRSLFRHALLAMQLRYPASRHVSAIFCADDGSCYDRATNVSNLPASRLAISNWETPRNADPSLILCKSQLEAGEHWYFISSCPPLTLRAPGLSEVNVSPHRATA